MLANKRKLEENHRISKKFKIEDARPSAKKNKDIVVQRNESSEDESTIMNNASATKSKEIKSKEIKRFDLGY